MKTTDKMVVKKSKSYFDDKYLIVVNKFTTILLSKKDSNKKYILKGPSKIIFDNIDKSDNEIIELLYKKYDIDKNILKNDYYDFINEINNLDIDKNDNTIDMDGRDFLDLLGSSKVDLCTIEITNQCCFFCDHCYVEKSKNTNMSFETFKKIIDELHNIKCCQILITGGEPLMNPYFIKMYEYAKQIGFMVNINTNGFMINDKIMSLFNKYKPELIEISLYGYDNKSYYNFTHIKNAFSKVEKNINLIIKNNITLNLKSVLTKRNSSYMNKLIDYANSINIPFRYDYIIFPKVDGNEFRRNEESLSPKEIVSVLEKDNKAKDYFNKAVIETNKNKYKDNTISNIFECGIGSGRLFIDCKGNIKPCLVIDDKYNINEYTIVEALDKIKNGICKLKFKNKSKCINCYKRSICRYCPARFYLETKSYEKPPKFYCDLADLIIKKFDNKIKFEHYNYNKKIPLNKVDKMLEIIVKFYNSLNNIDNSTKEMTDPWVKMIRNTKDYEIELCYINDELIGFINYMYQKEGLMISEVQIKDTYQGKGILKKMILELINNIDETRFNTVLGTINKKNIHSQEVFGHIGFSNIENNLYKISYSKLKDWCKEDK